MEKFIPEILRGNLSPVYCPLCSTQLTFSNSNSINCLNGHSYEIAPSGYIDMYSVSATNRYKAGNDISVAIERELCGLLYAEYAMNNSLTILDTSAGFQELFSNILMSMRWDLYRYEAIGLVPGMEWMPLHTGAVDIVLNILSDCNLEECVRILKPGGLLVKTISLQDLNNVVKQVIRQQAFSDIKKVEIDGSYAILCCRKAW